MTHILDRLLAVQAAGHLPWALGAAAVQARSKGEQRFRHQLRRASGRSLTTRFDTRREGHIALWT
jgi:hypothetical protein